MKLNELSSNPKATQKRKRRGQGIGSGLGKTSGRGHKGYKARSGSNLNGFEGGQTPIHMRIPKRGFSNKRFAKRYAIVNLGRLQESIDKGVLTADEKIDAKLLKDRGVIRHIYNGVRVLNKGTLNASLNIEAVAASKNAIKAVSAAGGEVKIIIIKKVESLPSAETKSAETKIAENESKA